MANGNNNNAGMLTEKTVADEIARLRKQSRALRSELSAAKLRRQDKLAAFVGRWALEHMPMECEARLSQISKEDREMAQALAEHQERVAELRKKNPQAEAMQLEFQTN